MRKESTIEEREKIIDLKKKDKSWADIEEITGVNKETARKIWRRYKINNNIEDSKKRGRKEKWSKREKNKILLYVKKNRNESWRDLKNDINVQYGLNVSHEYIRKLAMNVGFSSKLLKKRPKINKKQKKKRIDFIKEYGDWDEEDWARVLFSDEVTFYFKKHIGKQFMILNEEEERSGQFFKEYEKHGGGSKMAWCCMSSKGIGVIHFIHGNLDAVGYKRILRKYLKIEGMGLCGENFYFQQDNAP